MIDSFYQIVKNKIFFSDRRLDKFRKPIIKLFEKLEGVYNSNFPQETIEKIIKKRKDCNHKITAVRYTLALIQSEMSKKMSAQDARNYSGMIRNGFCDQAELTNEVLIYETEAFLFQVKSSLDVMVQLLKNIPGYESLNLGGNIDRESFDIDRKPPKKSTPQKIREAGDLNLADYLDQETDLWIRDVNSLRNEITHRSGLNGFTSFVYISGKGTLVDPKMPDGTEVDRYCQDIYDKLFNLFDRVITDFIISKY